MENIKKYQHIAHIIYKQQTAHLNKKETDILNDWLIESDTHRELYEKIRTKEYVKDIEFYNSINTSAAWKKYTQKHPQKQQIKTMIAWSLAVACFIGIIILSVVLTKSPENNTSPLLTAAIIQPGSSKAILILNNGKSVDLTSAGNNRIVTSEYTEANNTGSQISYAGKENSVFIADKEDVFNEIVIPRGGEYKVVLSDGTCIWLNSQTKLKYPVKFTQSTRNVYLEGEAFFEVVPDTQKPFFVHLDNSLKIRVLGTSFNIRAYPDEEITETVLEKGSVKVESAVGNITLQPSFMFEYDKKVKAISKKEVDVELYIAWKDGRYVFYNESIENILHKLSRWYNIDIVFKDEAVKKLSFNGNVKKYENVNTLLNAFETSGGIDFEIDGKKVIVSSSVKK